MLSFKSFPLSGSFAKNNVSVWCPYFVDGGTTWAALVFWADQGLCWICGAVGFRLKWFLTPGRWTTSSPFHGQILDPASGSGMFVQSEVFVEPHKKSVNEISIYGAGESC
jgi:hypothetical protein